MHRRTFLETAGRIGLVGAATAVLERQSHAESRPRIKIGQIGTGHAHAAGKMATLRKLSAHYEVVGIAEPNEQLRKTLGENSAYRGLPLLTEEELLNASGLQAVAVETHVRDLVPTAARCVAAGLHIHLDKPAGESLSAFSELLANATRRQRVVQMGYMFRYNPAFQFCIRAVREGWLGDIFEVHGVMSKQVDPVSRRRLAEYRGGSMFELGCHLIDALVAVLGTPERTTAFVRKTRPEVDELSDNQIAVFDYPRATATIRSSLIEPHGGERRQFIVCGTQGTVEIRPLEPPRLLLALDRARGEYRRGYQEVMLPPSAGRYDGDFIDLAAAIRGEKPFPFTPEHDLAVHEAVLRASGVPLEPQN